ncbi:hypothetical protein CBR_g4056 [Chara braunii]|uniref:Uncharacterized protein n=1 Tax=Chara braunii TaxID=69332 RepID=A0A388KH42_CHABU|nr:hypothetical protein CBR_g4056 [Chara braunii]|eukprot:GBG69362.1 hypothetical protein CBR_g4056 [Chara braunii]
MYTNAKGSGSMGSLSNYAFSFGNLGGSGSRGSTSPTSLAQQKTSLAQQKASGASSMSSSSSPPKGSPMRHQGQQQQQSGNPAANLWGGIGEGSGRSGGEGGVTGRSSTPQQSAEGAFANVWASSAGGSFPSKTTGAAGSPSQAWKPASSAPSQNGASLWGATSSKSPSQSQALGSKGSGGIDWSGSVATGQQPRQTTNQQQDQQQRRGSTSAEDVFAGLWGTFQQGPSRARASSAMPAPAQQQASGSGRGAEPSLKQLRERKWEASGREEKAQETSSMWSSGESAPAVGVSHSTSSKSDTAVGAGSRVFSSSYVHEGAPATGNELRASGSPPRVPGASHIAAGISGGAEGGDPFSFLSGDLGPPPSASSVPGNGGLSDDPFGFLGIPVQAAPLRSSPPLVEEDTGATAAPAAASEKPAPSDAYDAEPVSAAEERYVVPPSGGDDINLVFGEDDNLLPKAQRNDVPAVERVGGGAVCEDPLDFMFGGGKGVGVDCTASADRSRENQGARQSGVHPSFDISWDDDEPNMPSASQGAEVKPPPSPNPSFIAPPPRPKTSISSSLVDDMLSPGSSSAPAPGMEAKPSLSPSPLPPAAVDVPLASRPADPSMALFDDLFGAGKKESATSAGPSVGAHVDFDMWGDDDGGGTPAPAGSEDHIDGVPPPPPGLSLAGTKEKGDSFYKGGQFGDAIKYYSWAFVLSQREGHKNVQTIVEVLLNRAMSYKEAGDCRRAVDDCSKVLELQTTNVSALEKRAFLYESMEKYKLGVADFKKILEMEPGHREGIRGLARLQKAMRSIGE